MTIDNYSALFCAKLEAMILAGGGVVPVVSGSSNFQQRSLQLLDTLAGLQANLAQPPAIGATAPNVATFTTLTASSLVLANNQVGVTLALSLANSIAGANNGSRLNFKLFNIDCGGWSFKQENTFTADPATHNASATLNLITAGSVGQQLKIFPTGRSQFGTVTDDGVSFFQVGGSIRGTTLKLGSTIFTISTTEPAVKNPGDHWLEVNGSNLPLFGWWWHWNGTYWLSPDQFFGASFAAVTAPTGGAVHYLYCSNKYNYYFKSLSAAPYVTVAQDGTNHWLTDFKRIGSAAETLLKSVSTNGDSAVTFTRDHPDSGLPATGLHVDVAALGVTNFAFRITSSNLTTAGTYYGAPSVVFNFARIMP